MTIADSKCSQYFKRLLTLVGCAIISLAPPAAAEAEKTSFDLHIVPIMSSIEGKDVTSAALSAGGLLAMGTAAGHLSIVDRNLRPWHGGWQRSTGSSPILELTFSQDEIAVAGRTNDALAIWHLNDQTVDKIPLKTSPSAMGLSSDGRLIALAHFDVSVFDVSAKRLVRGFQQDIGGGGGDVYEDVAFSSDTSVVAAASVSGIDAWNMRSSKKVQQWSCKCGADGVSLSKDATLAVIGTSSAHALLWESISGKVVKDKNMSSVLGDHVYGTAVSLDGTLVAVGTAAGSVAVWNTVSGVIVARAQPSRQPIVHIRSSNDGRVLLIEGQKAQFAGESYDRWLITLTPR